MAIVSSFLWAALSMVIGRIAETIHSVPGETTVEPMLMFTVLVIVLGQSAIALDAGSTMSKIRYRKRVRKQLDEMS